MISCHALSLHIASHRKMATILGDKNCPETPGHAAQKMIQKHSKRQTMGPSQLKLCLSVFSCKSLAIIFHSEHFTVKLPKIIKDFASPYNINFDSIENGGG